MTKKEQTDKAGWNETHELAMKTEADLAQVLLNAFIERALEGDQTDTLRLALLDTIRRIQDLKQQRYSA